MHTADPRLYLAIVHSLEDIGWGHVIAIDAALAKATLAWPDSTGRLHELTLVIPSRYPALPPICTAALPVPFLPTWLAGTSRYSVLNPVLHAHLQDTPCSPAPVCIPSFGNSSNV